MDGVPTLEILNRKLVRDWSESDAIYVGVGKNKILYYKNTHKILVRTNDDKEVQIPDKFPIEDPEDFFNNPWKYLAPHVNKKHIWKHKATKSGTFKIYVKTPRKTFISSVKKTKRYFIYRNVPFVEGLYDVKVPRNEKVYIDDIMSIKEFPDTIKVKERLFITDTPGQKVCRVDYNPDAKYYTIITEKYEITWDMVEENITIRDRYSGKLLSRINDVDEPQLILSRLLESKNPVRTAKFISGLV